MQQKIWFGGYKWTIFSDFNYNYSSIPNLPCVYLFLIKLDDASIPAYIGVTKYAYTRMKSHEVLRLLQYNKKNYKIDILCKDFGKRWTNNYKEKDLIKKYKPPFNMGQKIYDFWESIGVDYREVVYKKPRESKTTDNQFIRL